LRKYIAEDLNWKTNVAGPVITAFNNVSTAGKVSTKVIMFTAKLFLAIGAILGSVYAFREWINKR
jgi:hypothetical protein